MARFMSLKCQGPLTVPEKADTLRHGCPTPPILDFRVTVRACCTVAGSRSVILRRNKPGWLAVLDWLAKLRLLGLEAVMNLTPDRRHKLDWKSVRVGGGVH
ncbi:hypothetical protein QR685DRAFT_568881 [Neurospora intermedia]|uniref:Uncharacterized protein n=1 Tax=Neurospora intermedia TaxID=5142 RepID=A0ABR3DUA2_NEUIN